MKSVVNPFNANFTKWSNTLKQFVGNLTTNCLSVFEHFAGLALKGLTTKIICLLLKYKVDSNLFRSNNGLKKTSNSNN